MINKCRGLLGIVSLGLATTLALTACGGGGGDRSADVEQTLTLGGFNYDTLDPGAATGFIGPSLPMARPIYGWLFEPPLTPDGDFVPNLATAYDYAADLKSVTITLREGVTFHDGTPFDAEAIVFNIKRYASKQSPNKQWYADVAKAEALDAKTVKVTFTAPDANFINMLAYTSGGLFSSPTAYEKAGEEKYGLHVVGAGPYELVSMTPGQELVMKPYAKFWDAGKAKLTEIKYVHSDSNPAINYQSIVSGALDQIQVGATNTPANVLAQAKANSDIKMTAGPDNAYIFLALNTAAAPFNNPEARHAINYCTDREALAQGLTQGFANPAYVDAGRDAKYYPFGGPDGAKAAFPYPYNVEKAKATVAALGGLSFKFVNLGGQALTVANALAQSWKECGIDAQVATIPGPQLAQAFAKGDFQMAMSPEGGLSDPHFYRSFQQDTTPQGSHTTKPLGPTIPNLVKKVYQTTDEAELKQLFTQLFTEINVQGATIPLISGPNYYISNKCVTGANLRGYGASYEYASKTC